MYTVIAWLLVAVLVVMLISVVDVTVKYRKETTKKIGRLSEQLEAQKRISKELCVYVTEISKVNGDKQNVSEQIKEAQNDEEILAIIAGLVSTNNNRVSQ